MSKKDFIALADYIKNRKSRFSDEVITELACFCILQNHRFLAQRWVGYINGECGPNGGKVKGA